MPTPREKFREWLTENVADALWSPYQRSRILEETADKAAEFFTPAEPCPEAARYASLDYRGDKGWLEPDGNLLDYEEVADIRTTLAEAYLREHGYRWDGEKWVRTESTPAREVNHER